MFFREKESKKSKRPTLQLVENYRDGNKVRQQIVVSLGVGFDIPPKDRKAVAAAVEQKLWGQPTLFAEPEITSLAERVVKRIQTNGRWSPKKPLTKEEDVAQVYINKVEHENDRILGPLLIGHTFWQRLGFPDILSQCGFNGRQIDTAEISGLDRLIAQDSEHAIPSWIKTAAVEELIDKRAEEYGDDRFYRISDKLLKNQKFIEEQLYNREKNLFNLHNAIYLYDLTNTYFEGLCKSNPKAQFNKNQKEKRADCRQIVIALVLDQEGFIRRHRIFNGKMTDVKSLKEILKALRVDFPADQLPTIIVDRGVVSEGNIELLKSSGFKYIVATRSGEEKDFIDDFIGADFRVLKDKQVEVFLKKEAEETYLLCKSQPRRAKEEAMRNQAEERLEEDIAKLAKLVETGRRTDPLVIQRAIGRVKERHARVAHYYEIEYIPFSFDYQIPQDAGIAKRLLNSLQKLKQRADQYKISHLKLRSELEKLSQRYPQDYAKVSTSVKEPHFSGKPIDEKRGELQALDGNYLLRTNRDDLTDDAIWNMYVMLTRVERAFRNLKTDLGLRPNFHQEEGRVDGHVFITILAYHLLHSIEYTLREGGWSSSWATIKRVVSTHTYSTIILPTTSGTVIHLRKPGRPEAVHTQVYEKLRINVEDLPIRKVVVEQKVR